jgi:regulator of nucleoside diphosphate kinase
MNNAVVKLDSTPIILSRGIFDLLRAHIKSKKLSKYNEAKLELELKTASQVLRSELPENIVDVDTRVRVKEVATGNEFTYNLVAPKKARNKHNTLSILSPIGVAMLGYPQGAELQWEMEEGVKVYRIEEVSRLKVV